MRSSRRSLSSAPVAALVVVLASVLLGPRPVHAGQGETEWGVAVGASQDSAATWAGRFAGGVHYNLHDLWSVGGLVLGDAGETRQDIAALARGRMIIDALTWVPSVTVGAGVTSLGGGTWLARAAAEIAYRPSRPRSWFLRFGAEISGVSTVPAIAIELGARWHFSPADALDF